MSDTGVEPDAPGRPSAGQTLAQGLADAKARRGKSRNVRALSRLFPFIAAHWGDAALTLVFLLLSTGATLGVSGAVRLLVDHLTAAGATGDSVHPWFFAMGGVVALLGLASACRYFFVTKLG